MNYDANSVQQLTFREGVRKRVGIYLGSADNTGVIAGLLELINNATDEALVCPAANQIEITIVLIGQVVLIKAAECRTGQTHLPMK